MQNNKFDPSFPLNVSLIGKSQNSLRLKCRISRVVQGNNKSNQKWKLCKQDLHKGWASADGAGDNSCPQKIKQKLLKYEGVEFKI